MLEELLPSAVACEERFDDLPDSSGSGHPGISLARGAERRRREHASARHCARLALERLGIPGADIGRGPAGEPLWPAGVVGSITHCDGYRAAAVARDPGIGALGIDAEPNQALPEGVESLVLVGEEREAIERLARARPQTSWDRLIFSAKEALYKAWSPLTHRWLDFEEAVLTLVPDSNVFIARLTVTAPEPFAEGVRGRWLLRGGLLLTAVVVGPGSAAAQ
jgi:4'-phosphopantetheinyl transferase EntD